MSTPDDQICKTPINSFRGEYHFLSNFYPCGVTIDNITYQCAEAAFQAQKSLIRNVQFKFAKMTGAEAKRAGRKIKLNGIDGVPYHDWEETKCSVMKNVLKAKFSQSKDLQAKLLGTGNRELIEGNTWGDKYWGQCNGIGENKSGKLLMQIRNDLQDLY